MIPLDQQLRQRIRQARDQHARQRLSAEDAIFHTGKCKGCGMGWDDHTPQCAACDDRHRRRNYPDRRDRSQEASRRYRARKRAAA